VSGVHTASLGTARVCRSPLELIGQTPVLRIGTPFIPSAYGQRGFWAKLEGFNPGGIKDRAAHQMLLAARARGDLQPGGTIVESSSGTFALGLALAGIGLGHPVTIVHEPLLEPMLRYLLQAYGVHLECVTEPHPTGGWTEARRERVRQLCATIPGAYWPNQYDNPDGADAYTGLAEELLAQFAWIDVLVCSVGTGGHSAGVARRLRQRWPDLRVIGVDAAGSVTFGQSGRRGVMRGLGNSIFPRNVAYEQFDEVHWVTDGEAVQVCRQLARQVGVTGGWSVGCVALVARWAAQTAPADATVVTIFPDGPERYWNTVFDDGFCAEHGLLDVEPAAEPEEIASPLGHHAARWTRCRTVLDPRASLASAGMGAGAS
jgi:S-sulfo-L-cysteine synthase (3-phospho-L-serine-dependent)